LTAFPAISVVDDDPSVAAAIDDLLKSSGYSTECFTTVDGFLSSDALWKCVCIVSDLHMPGRNGVEQGHALQSKGIETPVIIVSAQGKGAKAAEALKSGAFALIEKPFMPERFLDQVRSAIWRALPPQTSRSFGS